MNKIKPDTIISCSLKMLSFTSMNYQDPVDLEKSAILFISRSICIYDAT